MRRRKLTAFNMGSLPVSFRVVRLVVSTGRLVFSVGLDLCVYKIHYPAINFAAQERGELVFCE